MRALVETIESLRKAVSADSPDHPSDFDAVPGRGALAELKVTRDQAGRATLVVVSPAQPAALSGLSAAFGKASRLPSRPSGGTRTVLFRDTLPSDGESGVTVLAELDKRGHAARVLLRRDEL